MLLAQVSFQSLFVTYHKTLTTFSYGIAGLGVLRVLLSDNSVSHVTYLGRRPLPPWVVLPGGTSDADKPPTHPKLFTIEHKDFLTYPSALKEKLAEHDACIWALGTTSVGMSEEKYTEITVGYFDTLLDALKEKGVGTAESPFRVVFVSGMGADSKETSRTLFERVKVRNYLDTSFVNFLKVIMCLQCSRDVQKTT